MKRELIRINNLSFKYEEDSADVLKNINLSILSGEWISIVGHNGSGKSTLAKFLNGLIVPDAANVVSIGGLDTFNQENIWEVRKRVGMVFQNPDNQMVATTVRDDVAFGLENLGINREEMLQRIDWAIHKVKMSQFLNHEPHRLSGGQKQRVAIAGTIAMHPSIIILDEATSMLDPIGREEVLETVLQLCKEEGITIINITHDLEETLHSDKMVVMNKGEISLQGCPQEVFAQSRKIADAGLELPYALQVQDRLSQKGVQLSSTCLTKEDLVNELWKLKSQT